MGCKTTTFPDNFDSYLDADTLLCFVDNSWTLSEVQKLQIKEAMKVVKGLIIGTRTFFKVLTPEEKEDLVNEIIAMGYQSPIEVFKSNFEGWEDNFPSNRIFFFKKAATGG